MMELSRHILDKELLCRRGLRAGKADDLWLEFGEPIPGAPLAPPAVAAIIAGPLALSRNLPRPVFWLAERFYRLLGLDDPHPIEIPWATITEIDVVIHLDLDRDEAGLTDFQQAVARRYIDRLPGA